LAPPTVTSLRSFTLSDYKGASNARKYGSVIASPKFLEEFFARTVTYYTNSQTPHSLN
jgi:hypothetical protein